MPLAHSTVGPPDAPVIVFLHGFLGGKSDWMATTTVLRESYRCVSIDLPGHGESPDDPESCSIESVATALIDLVDTLDAPSFSMVGYSMGGRIALYVASIYAMRVDALVLESSSPGLRSETERAERRATDERWARMLEEVGMKTFLDAWYEQPLFASLVSRADLIEQIKTKRLANNPRALARALRGFSVGRQAPLWDEWKANLIPTLIVAGELDVKYSVLAHEMVLLSRKSSYTMFQNVGHNVHEEAPDAYNRVIHAFLDETIKV